MTVNHDVAGSSPAGGAKTKRSPTGLRFCFAFFCSVHAADICLKSHSAERGDWQRLSFLLGKMRTLRPQGKLAVER